MKRLLRWIASFFKRENPPAKLALTEDVLNVEVMRAIQAVLIQADGYIPWDEYEVIDMECKAMSIFMKSIVHQHYVIRKGQLVKARKLIRQHRWMFQTGKFI